VLQFQNFNEKSLLAKYLIYSIS